MLGQAPNVSNSQSQSSIRHQVRKLRAKVKSLVPVEICGKYKKRNNRISQIQKLEKDYQQMNKTNGKQQMWKFTTGFNTIKTEISSNRHIVTHQNKKMVNQQKNTLKKIGLVQRKFNTIDGQNRLNLKQQSHHRKQCKHKQQLSQYHFNKLTPNQIQQINEDKLYYLGHESNIEAYNQFLQSYYEQKSIKKQQLVIKNKYPSSLYIEEANKKQERSNNNKNRETNRSLISSKLWKSQKHLRSNSEINKYNRKSFCVKKAQKNQRKQPIILLSQTEQQPQFVLNTMLKKQRKVFNNLQQRKQYLKSQLDKQLDYQKGRIKERISKSEANHRQVCYSRYSRIKKGSKLQSQKINKARYKKLHIQQDKGYIEHINQILRHKIINKKPLCRINQKQYSQVFVEDSKIDI